MTNQTKKSFEFNGNFPVVVEIGENKNFIQKKEMTEFELRGVYSFLDEYLTEFYDDGEKYDSATDLALGYVGGVIACTTQTGLPGAPQEVKDYQLQYFALTENNVLLAVVEDENNKSYYIRIN
jgi:hypothetical protein